MTSKGFKSTIYGCTCDGIDRLVEDIMLPDLMFGEYLYVENMGAYNTLALFNHEELFNGFSKPSIQ
jgi:ornithine decarboxylase